MGAAAIAGYAGKSNTLDKALFAFALDYADQNDRDYALFAANVKRVSAAPA